MTSQRKLDLAGTHSTVGKRAKRMPDTTNSICYWCNLNSGLDHQFSNRCLKTASPELYYFQQQIDYKQLHYLFKLFSQRSSQFFKLNAHRTVAGNINPANIYFEETFRESELAIFCNLSKLSSCSMVCNS